MFNSQYRVAKWFKKGKQSKQKRFIRNKISYEIYFKHYILIFFSHRMLHRKIDTKNIYTIVFKKKIAFFAYVLIKNVQSYIITNSIIFKKIKNQTNRII